MENLKALKRQRRELDNKIYEIEERKWIEKNQQFVGKFFKYENSYGDGDKWGVYRKVTGCDRKGTVLFFSFQYDH